MWGYSSPWQEKHGGSAVRHHRSGSKENGILLFSFLFRARPSLRPWEFLTPAHWPINITPSESLLIAICLHSSIVLGQSGKHLRKTIKVSLSCPHQHQAMPRWFGYSRLPFIQLPSGAVSSEYVLIIPRLDQTDKSCFYFTVFFSNCNSVRVRTSCAFLLFIYFSLLLSKEN